MHPAKGGVLRRTEHWLVNMVMAALALVLERLVVRSIRRGERKGRHVGRVADQTSAAQR